MNPFFGSVFWLLVTLGVLVTFHEFGHFWVARRCGVKVLRFSVGFGRAIWKRTARDGTQYQVAMIPLGGYVKMLDAREGEVDPALQDQEFTGKSVWKRIAIVAAGPAFNLIFTLAAFWLMFMIGRPDAAPIVTAKPQSMAAEAGIRPGDRLLQVGDRKVATWSDAMETMTTALLGRDRLPLQVRSADGSEHQVVLPLDQLPAGQDIGQYMDTLGLQPGARPAVVDEVMAGKPAALAGMRPGDRVLSINGQPVSNWSGLHELIPSLAAKSPDLTMLVSRDGRQVPLHVVARKESLQGQPVSWVVGVGITAVMQRYGPIRAIGQSLDATWNSASQTFEMIGKMITGRASTKNLSSPVGIGQAANQFAGMGVAWFLYFLGLVSLSLCILNLLPIPLLDGGHLLYYLIELVKGSPVSERVMIAGQYIGLLLLFSMMGLAFYNDIHRMLLS